MLARNLDHILPHIPEKIPSTTTFSQETDEDNIEVVVFHWGAEEIKTISTKSKEVEKFPDSPGCLTKFCNGFKTLVGGTVAVATAVPAGIYALLFTSGESPDKIGEAWWYSMSYGERTFSVFNALIALIINTFVNLKYIPEAMVYLKKNFQSCCHTLGNFLCGKTALVLAMAASLAAGALGYESFIWLSEILSILVATSNFLTYGARRYASIASLIERIRNFFDSDVRFQQAFINQLKLLKTEYFPELNQFLDGKTLNEETVRELLIKVYDEAVRLDLEKHDKSPEIFNSLKKWDKAKEYIGLTFDIGLGFVCAYYFFPVYAQKGFDGMKIFWKYTSDPTFLDRISQTGQIGISFAPGMASSLLGFVGGYDFRKILISSLNKSKSKTLVVLVGSGIACTAQANIAKEVVDSPNLFGLVNNSNGNSFILFNGFASGCFLFNGIAKFNLKENISESKPTVKDTIHWLEKNKLSTATLEMLRKHSFFNKKKAVEKKQQIIQTHAIQKTLVAV